MEQPETETGFRMKKHWTAYMAPQITENFIISASIHPNTNYIGPSKQRLFIIPRDKRTIRRPGTIKRPISRPLDEELPSTAVKHSSTGPSGPRWSQSAASQETVRPGKDPFFIPVSISYAFPWSLLMAAAKQERSTLEMTQHGSTEVFLEHTSLAIQPGAPTNLSFSTATSSSRSWCR